MPILPGTPSTGPDVSVADVASASFVAPSDVRLSEMAERLARWSNASVYCVDVFQACSPEAWGSAIEEAMGTIQALEVAVACGTEPAGLMASDLKLRQSLVCSCEMHLFYTLWTDLSVAEQQRLRLLAARCVGACGLDMKALDGVGGQQVMGQELLVSANVAEPYRFATIQKGPPKGPRSNCLRFVW